MKLSTAVSFIVGLVTSTAVETIAEDLTKKALPTAVSTTGSYAVRLGASFVGGLVGGIVCEYVIREIKDIFDIVQSVGTEEEPETVVLEKTQDTD